MSKTNVIYDFFRFRFSQQQQKVEIMFINHIFLTTRYKFRKLFGTFTRTGEGISSGLRERNAFTALGAASTHLNRRLKAKVCNDFSRASSLLVTVDEP